MDIAVQRCSDEVKQRQNYILSIAFSEIFLKIKNS